MSPLCPLELFQCMPYTFALTGANIIYMLRKKYTDGGPWKLT